MPQPFRYDAAALNLGPRFFYTTTVSASPTAAAETIVATLPTIGDLGIGVGVKLEANLKLTIGASGTTTQVRVRQTNVSGTVVADSGAITTAAAGVFNIDCLGIDTAPTLPGQVYVVTVQVANAAAASTVTPLFASALVI